MYITPHSEHISSIEIGVRHSCLRDGNRIAQLGVMQDFIVLQISFTLTDGDYCVWSMMELSPEPHSSSEEAL